MFISACGPGHVPFNPNGNTTAPNLNMNGGLPQFPALNMSQNLSFLSVPPPNLFASQHGFPSPINTTTAFHPSNMTQTFQQPSANSSRTNVPDVNIFQNFLQRQVQPFNNLNNGQNFVNPGYAGNVAHSVPFSQPGNSFNLIQNPNSDNRSLTPHYNPWSPPPSNVNNFSNSPGNTMPSPPIFQSSNRFNVWSDPSRNSATNVSPKFSGFKPNASDIKPWMGSSPPIPNISFNNYGNGERHMQSPSGSAGYNSKNTSSWNTNSSNKVNNFKFSKHNGKPYQSNWKSGKFSSIKSVQNDSSFQHSGNSLKEFHNKKSQRRRNSSFKAKEENGGNKPYACDTCDRAFVAEQELKLHLSEHIKCNAGNCDFEAHPKIVALHKKMQHETGYSEAINKLKDAEEIAKWRAERKRRFPTAENILKRKAEQAEKEARGEIIQTKDFGQMKKPRMENRFNKRNNRKDRRNKQFNNANVHFRNEKLLSTPKEASNVSLDSDSDSDVDSHIKLHQFPGINYLKENPVVLKPKEEFVDFGFDRSLQNELDCEKISVLDDNKEGQGVDSDESPVKMSVVKIPPVVDVFSAKEDSDDEPPTEKCIEREMPENKDSDIQEINGDSDDESPVEVPIVKTPLNEISNSDELISKDKPADKHSMNKGVKSNRKFPDRNRNKFANSCNFVDEPPVRKSTLLEKLLADDIRHERNVIMQCIRYIVKNNFFDVQE